MVAFGCAAIVGAIFLSSTKRDRRSTLFVVWTICMETLIAYILKAVVVPPSCPLGFGGVIGPRKRFIASLVRTVFWLFSTPAILLLFSRAAGLPRSWQAAIVANAFGAVLISTSITAPQSLGSWIVAAVFASATQLAMLGSLVLCCVFALRRTSDRFTFWAIIILGSLVTLSAMFYVVVSMMVQAGFVSNQVYLLSLPFLDLVARLASACIFVAGNFRSEELMIERELVLLERQRQEAEATNAARRQFVRWLFHECRIPLAALALAIEEASELLPIVEANTNTSTAKAVADDAASDAPAGSRTRSPEVPAVANRCLDAEEAKLPQHAPLQQPRLVDGRADKATASMVDINSGVEIVSRGSSDGSGSSSSSAVGVAAHVMPAAAYRMADLEEPLRIARESAAVMQRLLDQVLMMSKIEAGEFRSCKNYFLLNPHMLVMRGFAIFLCFGHPGPRRVFKKAAWRRFPLCCSTPRCRPHGVGSLQLRDRG